jgi:hypothetical protein
MLNTPKSVSPWDITLPLPAPLMVLPPVERVASERLSDDAFAEFKLGVEEMLDACGPETNTHERLANVITACIEAGFTTSGGIIATAMTFGFKRGHAGSILTHSTVGKSQTPRWRRDSKKRYSLIS